MPVQIQSEDGHHSANTQSDVKLMKKKMIKKNAQHLPESTGSEWRVGLWGEVWEGRGRMLQRMMGRKLIHSRTTTREHFFYGNPKLETRERGLLLLFVVRSKVIMTYRHFRTTT